VKFSDLILGHRLVFRNSSASASLDNFPAASPTRPGRNPFIHRTYRSSLSILVERRETEREFIMTIAMADLFALGITSPDFLSSKSFWAYLFCILWYGQI
jgi:hypothetical protein